jgi:hypothetical protein
LRALALKESKEVEGAYEKMGGFWIRFRMRGIIRIRLMNDGTHLLADHAGVFSNDTEDRIVKIV